jgi:transcriptional regulator with XRE-family HTH domain
MMKKTVRVDAEKLRTARLRMGWSMRELAEASRIGCDTISNLENQRQQPRISTVRKLAHALGLPVDTLIKLEMSEVTGMEPAGLEERGA